MVILYYIIINII